MIQEISDVDYISRYCSPSNVENGMPKISAFMLRDVEKYLSGNQIPNGFDIDNGMMYIRNVFAKKKYGVKSDGRFAIFNVGQIKKYVHELTGVNIMIEHRPMHNDPTHASIRFPIGDDSAKHNTYIIAYALCEFIKENTSHIYPAVL